MSLIRGLLNSLSHPPRLGKRTILLILAPAIGWIWVFKNRSSWIDLSCGKAPETCLTTNLPFIDRFTVELGSRTADVLSDWGQNLSGAIALAIPLILSGLIASRQPNLKARLRALKPFLVDFAILFQATLWNGFLNELVRSWIQRPRPFVYLNPLKHGFSAAHYTSFYSGHTSFAALAGVSLVTALYARRVSKSALRFTTGGVVALILMTGIGRVISARHFPTDVIAGALIGTLIAISIAWVHRESVRSS